MGIEEALTAPRSPWQNAYAERFIGSVRRECLDHVIVFSAAGLQRLMQLYCAYYDQSRTHLVAEQGRADPSGDHRAGRWSRGGYPAGRRTASPVRTPSGLTARRFQFTPTNTRHSPEPAMIANGSSTSAASFTNRSPPSMASDLHAGLQSLSPTLNSTRSNIW
jgi:hypothetical protein